MPGAVQQSLELDCLTLLYFNLFSSFSPGPVQGRSQGQGKVEDEVDVALLYFVCIALLQKAVQGCFTLLYKM